MGSHLQCEAVGEAYNNPSEQKFLLQNDARDQISSLFLCVLTFSQSIIANLCVMDCRMSLGAQAETSVCDLFLSRHYHTLPQYSRLVYTIAGYTNDKGKQMILECGTFSWNTTLTKLVAARCYITAGTVYLQRLEALWTFLSLQHHMLIIKHTHKAEHTVRRKQWIKHQAVYESQKYQRDTQSSPCLCVCVCVRVFRFMSHL